MFCDPHSAEAEATRFLENVAGEPAGAVPRPHLSGGALRYYDAWAPQHADDGTEQL